MILNSITTPVNKIFYSTMQKIPVIGGLFGHTVNAPQNVKAFLMVIRSHESSLQDKAYNMVFGGGTFKNMSDHPVSTGEWKGGVYNGKPATPAGAYQITQPTWNDYKKRFGCTDFTPASQDKFAIGLIKLHGVYDMLLSGNIKQVMKVMSGRWASLPDSDSGQPKQTLLQALDTYKKYGGITS